jgi:hypothetical protein
MENLLLGQVSRHGEASHYSSGGNDIYLLQLIWRRQQTKFTLPSGLDSAHAVPPYPR